MKSRYDTRKLRKLGLSLRKIGKDSRVRRGKTTVERILNGSKQHSSHTITAVMEVIREAEAKVQGYRKAA